MGNQLRMLIAGNCLKLVPKLLLVDMRYLSAFSLRTSRHDSLDKVGEGTGVCEYHPHPKERGAKNGDDPRDIFE